GYSLLGIECTHVSVKLKPRCDRDEWSHGRLNTVTLTERTPSAEKTSRAAGRRRLLNTSPF
ncbi:hypothetical protein KUCAC02_032476, partial [Chaenocephalus aceratus]